MKKQITIKKQSGVVLAVSLIMLVLLTMIALSGTQVTNLEEKMAGNARDQNIAFQAAESTLVAAENLIISLTLDEINNTVPLPVPSGAQPFDGTGGLLGLTDNELDYFTNTTWSNANSHDTPAGFSGNLGLTANPRYIIKLIMQTSPVAATPNLSVFRITARATGTVAGTEVILQEIYERTN